VLPAMLERFTPDLVLYQGGVDPHEDDRLGTLALTIGGLRRRDRFVFDCCRDADVPVVSTMGGGYGARAAARNGLALLWFIIPRLVPALILAGMIQVVIPQETVGRYFGQQSGLSAIFIASAAGVITPGGPMVSVPLLVVLSNSGMALGPLVAYMTAWSLFGVQRIIAWEAPLMGWRFVAVRTASSLVFPIVAGWLVKIYFHE